MKMKMTRVGQVAAIAMIGGLMAAGPAKAVVVDAEILLLMDVSGSVDSTEFGLQKDGYEAAFRSTAVKNAIAASTNGVAISLVQWDFSQYVGVGWKVLTNATDSEAFADDIMNMTRLGPGNGNTGLGEALVFGGGQFGSNTVDLGMGAESIDGSRQVIDVSGDGADNNGGTTSAQGRDAVLQSAGNGGVVDVINGIVILGESGLLAHYQNQVIGGTNADGGAAFVLTASGFSTFQTAITNKLVAEVTGTTPTPGVPEPATMALFGIGLAGLGFTARRRRKVA